MGVMNTASVTLQGCWKAVLERTKGYKAAPDDEMLTLAAWHLFALAKLRMYREAESAFKGLGDLDAPCYVKQSSKGGSLHHAIMLKLRRHGCAEGSLVYMPAWKTSAVVGLI